MAIIFRQYVGAIVEGNQGIEPDDVLGDGDHILTITEHGPKVPVKIEGDTLYVNVSGIVGDRSRVFFDVRTTAKDLQEEVHIIGPNDRRDSRVMVRIYGEAFGVQDIVPFIELFRIERN